MVKKPKIGCLVASFSFLTFIGIIFFEFLSHHNVENKLGHIKGGLLALAFLFIGVVASDFTYRITSDNYSFRNLWRHYLSLMFLRVLSLIFYRRLHKASRNVERTQTDLLMKFVNVSRGTTYGDDHDFDSITCVADLRAKHPITYYEHYSAYVDRIAAGEENVMNKKQPYVLAITSGTSGTPKMMPTYPQQRSVFFMHGILPLFKVMVDEMPGVRNLQKKLKLFYTPKWRQSDAGISIGPNSSSPTNSSDLAFHSTPRAAFGILSEPDALYVYLLFALRDRKLGYIEANFASLVYTAFVSLEKNWKQLVSDVKAGTVSKDIVLDADIRQELEAELTPDPERADELETEFERGFLGIASKIWPYMNFIMCVDTGSFQVYGELLRAGYCKGVQIYSPIYAATEGLIGLNLWPHSEDKSYLLLPEALFYEFIPLDHVGEEQPETVLLHQVEKGELYEMVISNASGMYRYRFGDVIKVTGYHNSLPLVEFMYRAGQLLNVRGEKTSEVHFYKSLKSALAEVLPKGPALADYCCIEVPATTNMSPHYSVYVELADHNDISIGSLAELEKQLDERLCDSYVYKSFRAKSSIASVKLSLVHQGTFVNLRRYLIEASRATPNQYKVPRVLKNPESVDLVQQAVCMTTN